MKQCERCNGYFARNRQQRFCSFACRMQAWVENNQDKIRGYRYKHTRKKPAFCSYCDKLIPPGMRIRGRRLHIECIGLQKERIVEKFNIMKETLGCQICEYNHYGACIDFHHIDIGTKERRIIASEWYWKRKNMIKELEKCIPLCKNCHMEVHVFNSMMITKRSI